MLPFRPVPNRRNRVWFSGVKRCSDADNARILTVFQRRKRPDKRLNDGGQLEFTYMLAPADGLWVDGLDTIIPLTGGGQSYVIGVSAGASALVAVRLNPMGVFFVSDIVHDTRDTRFDDATTLTSFEAGGRSFVVTGGSDAGVSIFELLPGGILFHHQSLAQDTAWDLGPILSLEAVALDNEVQILVAGSDQGAGLAQLVLPLDQLGVHVGGSAGSDQLNGGAGDDILQAYSGNDTLLGGAGEDTLIAGTGADVLFGGGRADVFVFTADGQQDIIRDFEPGIDRLHLDDWGMVYDLSALHIQRSETGAIIRWRAEEVRIDTANGRPIEVTDWDPDDFLF